MVKVYIGIGSNLGKREENIQRAIGLIKKIENVKIKKSSSLYETEPVGNKKQPWFINCVLEVETKLSVPELLKNLLKIEKKLGRKRPVLRSTTKDERVKWSPRIIDLDILFYGEEIIEEKNLSIPHPRLNERKFVLVPLNEINPQIYHPQLKKTVHQLLNDLKNNPEQVRKMKLHPHLSPLPSKVAERRKGARALRHSLNDEKEFVS